MKNLKLNILFSFTLCTVFSCSSDAISDLTETDINTEIVTYTQKIKPIIDNHCINCHSANNPSANLRLDTYDNTRNAVLNKNLIERIQYTQGDPLMMPQNGNRLPQNNINLFIEWQNEGFQP